jgi:hypothetical protein
MIRKFNMSDTVVVWRKEPKVCAGLDPAFSAGGDRAVYTRCEYGLSASGIVTAKLDEPERIQLTLSSGEPMSYDLADKVINKLIRDGLTPAQLCLDVTGSQSSLADIIDVEWKKKMREYPKLQSGRCRRVSFGGSASDLPFSIVDNMTCKEKFTNKVSELWFMMRVFGMSDQIRGLSGLAINQFCTRLILNSNRGNKITIETKKDMKIRTGGVSPDDADSCVCVLEYLRHIAGVIPGGQNSVGMDDYNFYNLMSDPFDANYESEEALYDFVDI